MIKHAYLIIANRNFMQLRKLANLIDDERNDIYLMIDKKSKIGTFKLETKYSRVYYLPRIPIYWGDYSQIDAELKLFSLASKNRYGYYHLMSGLDLPLVSQNTIHSFFDKNPNKEFITYSAMSSLHELNLRLKKHHFTRHYRLIKGSIWNPFLRVFRKIEHWCLNRNIEVKDVSFGSNWVTLDDHFVQKMVNINNTEKIKDKYYKGYLVDELLIPFEVKDLGFESSVYWDKPVHDLADEFQGNLCYINWWKGSPYVWRKEDYADLVKARENGHLFARKFDENIDSEIINKIYRDLKPD